MYRPAARRSLPRLAIEPVVGVLVVGAVLLGAWFVPGSVAGWDRPAMAHAMAVSSAPGSVGVTTASTTRAATTSSDVDCGTSCPTGTVAACLAMLCLTAGGIAALLVAGRPWSLLGTVRRRAFWCSHPVAAAASRAAPRPWALCVMGI